MRKSLFLLAALPLLACSSSPPTAIASDAGSSVDSGGDASVAPGTVVEHGSIIEYFTLKPLAGLTVTDNGATTTTDANGKWSLTVPATSTLQPTVTGANYIQLFFPDSTAVGSDVDFGVSVEADVATYNLEQNSLDSFDSTKALVQVVLMTTGSCASVAGATVTVVSPPNALLEYFAAAGIPQGVLTTVQDLKPNRPAVVVYNIDPGAELVLQVDHPTCTQVPFPATFEGRTYPGHVRTQAAEPGDANSAMVIVMQ